MITEPRSCRIERGDEGVLLFELLEDRLRTGAGGERVGEGTADAVKDRRAQEQFAHLGRLALEHLGEEVAGDRPLASGELRDKALGVGARGERDGRQAQSGWPSLGAFVQRGDAGLREGYSARAKERAGLVEGEAQVRPAQLGELACEAEAVQPQCGVLARRQHDPELGR